MNLLRNLEALRKIKLNLENDIKKSKENKEHNVFLIPEEIQLFLEKLDVFKFVDRISTHYSITTIEEFKNLLGIPLTDNLVEKKLKIVFKNKNIIEEILTNNEKLKLKQIYADEYDKKIKKEKKAHIQKRELTEKLIKKSIEEIDNFIGSINLSNISKKKYKEFNNLKNKVLELLKYENKFLNKFVLLEERYKKLMNLGIKKDIKDKNRIGKHGEIDYKEIAKQIEETNKGKVEEFRRQQEKDLLNRIQQRQYSSKTQEYEKNKEDEKVIIEAYLDDFNSEKSRFVLSVLKGTNIKISFYNGVIKFIDNEKELNEINFVTLNNIIIFSFKEHEIEINFESDSMINDILIEQTSDIKIKNTILNCLSVLYFINTFYTNEEKIELSYSDYQNDKINKDNKNNKNIVYLNKNNTRKIKTIKIKKGRQITGKSLTRGHWRRQPYSDGNIKLIWIEPFWRGKGNIKEKIYKIIN